MTENKLLAVLLHMALRSESKFFSELLASYHAAFGDRLSREHAKKVIDEALGDCFLSVVDKPDTEVLVRMVDIPYEDHVTGRHPTAVRIQGRERPVESWQRVLQCVAEHAFSAKPALFALAPIGIIPPGKSVIAYSKRGMTKPRHIRGSRVYVELNQSAKDCVRLARAVAQFCGKLSLDYTLKED